MSKGAIYKFKCNKVLFNICCQDEIFLPDMLFFPLKFKKVDIFLL